MKLSRTQLKALIKECIVEVLSEGLAASSTSPLTEGLAFNKPRQPQRSQQSSRRTSLAESMLGDELGGEYDDDVRSRPNGSKPGSGRSTQQQQRAQKPPVPAVPAALQLGDPVMDSIFAHTAATTVLEQGHGPSRLEEAGSVAADPFARALAQHDPEDVFGEETAAKWSKFAFPDGRDVTRGSSPAIVEQAPPPRRPEPEVVPSSRVVRPPPLDFDPYAPVDD